MPDPDIPTEPIRIFNAEFPTLCIHVYGAADHGELCVYPDPPQHPDSYTNFIIKSFTFRKDGTGYHLISTVGDDEMGNQFPMPRHWRTAHTIAVAPDNIGPVNGAYLKACTEYMPADTTGPLAFQVYYVEESKAFQIFTRRGREYLFLSLQQGTTGESVTLNKSSGQPRQLWTFKPAPSKPAGLILGPGQKI